MSYKRIYIYISCFIEAKKTEAVFVNFRMIEIVYDTIPPFLFLPLILLLLFIVAILIHLLVIRRKKQQINKSRTIEVSLLIFLLSKDSA